MRESKRNSTFIVKLTLHCVRWTLDNAWINVNDDRGL